MKLVAVFVLLAVSLCFAQRDLVRRVGVESGCFQCSQALPTASAQFSSAASSDEACQQAQLLAELELRRQCSGFACEQQQQEQQQQQDQMDDQTAMMQTRCGLSLNNSTCRRRLMNQNNLWLCSVCCEGMCACEQGLVVTTIPLEEEVPVTPSAEETTTAAPEEGVVSIFELNHVPLGQARLERETDATDDFEETLLVTNVNSRNDGVMIDLPLDTISHSITWEFLEEDHEGGLEITPVGVFQDFQNMAAQANTLPGTVNEEDIWTLGVRGRGDGTAELYLQPGNLEFENLIVEAARGDQDILGSFQVNMNDLMDSEALAVFPMGRFTVIPFRPEQGGAPAALLVFEGPTEVRLNAPRTQQQGEEEEEDMMATTQQPQRLIVDRIILRALDGFAGRMRVTSLTNTRMVGFDLPQEGFRILNEEFISGSSATTAAPSSRRK